MLHFYTPWKCQKTMGCRVETLGQNGQKQSSGKVFQNSHEHTFARASFLIKDSSTDVFLWILWNFQEYLFYKAPLVAASKWINGILYCICCYLFIRISVKLQIIAKYWDKRNACRSPYLFWMWEFAKKKSFVTYSSTDNFLSLILVPDQLIFCCGNLIHC